MKIDISPIQMNVCRKKSFDFDYKLDSAVTKRMGIVESKPIKVVGAIVKEDDFIYAIGSYDSEFHFLCSRCLSDVFVDAKGEFKTLIVTTDDEDGYYLEGKLLNVDDIVTEEIIDNIPRNVLCSDECLGLCPKCGCNLNYESCNCDDNDVDPRFECLKNLLI